MKGWTNDYITATAQNSTTLATIIRIKRKDSVEYRFTDHDKPIVFGGLIYLPANSFSPTQFQTSATLSVDNLDITGIIAEIDGITEKDIYSDFFYSAQIWVSQVDYTDTAAGQNRIMYGSLGETTLNENIYTVEFRNLTFPLTRKVADVFSKTCRVEFGSERCGVDVEPSLWTSDTAYCTGDYVSSLPYDGKRYKATVPGTSQVLETSDYAAYVRSDANLVNQWSLEEDPYQTNVVLLMHMDGADASTTFTDETGKVFTAVADAQLKTATKYFGTASAYFDGTGDYIHTPTSTDWDCSTTYTAECWINLSSYHPTPGWWRCIFAWHTGTTGWRLLVGTNGQFHLAQDGGGGGGFYTANNVIDLNTWHHVAMVIRSDTVALAFVDGVLVNTGSAITVTAPTATTFKIGSTDGTNYNWHGYIDDVRITKGVARYTADFEVPTAPYSYATVAEDSEGSNNGTLINTPTLGTQGLVYTGIAPLGSSTCYTFDKTASSRISIPAAAAINNFWASGGKTLELWIKPTSSNGDGVDSGRIISKDDSASIYGSTLNGWALNIQGTEGAIYFFQRFDDGVSAQSYGQWYTQAGSIVAGNVYHVVVTYNGSSDTNTPSIWLNGVEQTLSIQNSPPAGYTASDDSGTELTIGGLEPSVNTRYYDGEIDEVSLYSSVLSDADIMKHHYIGSGGYLLPVFNQTIDGTTVDGTVTWTTKEALKLQSTVFAPVKFRLNIINAVSSSSPTGGVYIEELRLYDNTGTRVTPTSCVNTGGTYINQGCDKLSDGTSAAWAGNGPWENSEYTATLTFSAPFNFSHFDIEVLNTYIVSFNLEVSYDNETTWESVYEFRNGTLNQWITSFNSLLEVPKTEIQNQSRVRYLTDTPIFTDMTYTIDGVITWLTGENTGLSMEVTDYDSTSKELRLFAPMPYPISFGDTFEIIAGCNHLFLGSDGTTATGHCISRYANGNNFRGEPYVPTEDVLVGGIGETSKEGYVD